MPRCPAARRALAAALCTASLLAAHDPAEARKPAAAAAVDRADALPAAVSAILRRSGLPATSFALPPPPLSAVAAAGAIDD